MLGVAQTVASSFGSWSKATLRHPPTTTTPPHPPLQMPPNSLVQDTLLLGKALVLGSSGSTLPHTHCTLSRDLSRVFESELPAPSLVSSQVTSVLKQCVNRAVQGLPHTPEVLPSQPPTAILTWICYIFEAGSCCVAQAGPKLGAPPSSEKCMLCF